MEMFADLAAAGREHPLYAIGLLFALAVVLAFAFGVAGVIVRLLRRVCL